MFGTSHRVNSGPQLVHARSINLIQIDLLRAAIHGGDRAIHPKRCGFAQSIA